MLKQTLQQKQQQKMSPQQIQMVKLLEVPTSELEDKVKEELIENPVLEEGDKGNNNEHLLMQDSKGTSDAYSDQVPDYKMKINNYDPSSSIHNIQDMTVARELSLQEFLIEQLSLKCNSGRERTIGIHIIGNIDREGYLRRSAVELADDLEIFKNIKCTEEEIENIITKIKELDPPGVGASNLQECLLLQLKRQAPSAEVTRAIEIIANHFINFSKKHFSKVSHRLKCSMDELKASVEIILKLDPKPGSSIEGEGTVAESITPDFILELHEGELLLELNQSNRPPLRINSAYSDMLNEYSKKKKFASKEEESAMLFVKQKIDAAKWFIDAIKQRQHTLLSTMRAILQLQKEYFIEGDKKKLKPMILKDIAKISGYDISTISRVSNSKYIQTHFGTFSLKDFFSESIATESGEDVSATEVKMALAELIDGEDKKKPIPDNKLTSLLQEKGFKIARRTVAKYREQLKYPVARLRVIP